MVLYAITVDGEKAYFTLDHAMDIVVRLSKANIEYKIEPVGSSARKGEVK